MNKVFPCENVGLKKIWLTWLCKTLALHQGLLLLQTFSKTDTLFNSLSDVSTIIGSDDVLSPGRHQAIIWTNARMLLTEHLGTNFSEILTEIHIFSLKCIWKCRLKNGDYLVSASVCLAIERQPIPIKPNDSTSHPYHNLSYGMYECLHPSESYVCNYVSIPWSQLNH